MGILLHASRKKSEAEEEGRVRRTGARLAGSGGAGRGHGLRSAGSLQQLERARKLAEFPEGMQLC